MRLFLSGPMGSGKSTLGKVVSARTGMPLFDLDRCVEQRAGCSVPELFAQRGETAFRKLEGDVLRDLIAENTRAVFSLGGGTVTEDGLRRELLGAGVLVTLRAPIHELARRVGSGQGRPLLGGQDVVERLRSLLSSRASAYAECHADVDTEGLSPEELADAVIPLVADPPLLVPIGVRSYRVEIGAGVRSLLPSRLARLAKSPRVIFVTDEHVDPLWGDEVASLLVAAGREVTRVVLPAGEQHKNLATVQRIWDAALDAAVDRGSAVVALGGGVVGDLAGFAASTLLRGVPVAHVPSTLLAMVDSAVGGKTGFDSRHGKNLVGTFHQPGFVLCDVELLATLPEAERVAGLAEVAKSAWIEGDGSVTQLERDREALRVGERDATLRAVRMSAAMKARIVSADEREGGVRALLNLGHTVGHAIEAALGYSGMRHGEAVALGMVAALRLSARLGHASEHDVQRGTQLLAGLGLPTDVSTYLRPQVLSFIGADKKRNADRITYVLPGRPGDLQLRAMPVPELLSLLANLEA